MAARPAGPSSAVGAANGHPGNLLPARGIPSPKDAARLAVFMRDHPCWSVFRDKKHGVWLAAEDDPVGLVLYAEAADVDTVISYITADT